MKQQMQTTRKRHRNCTYATVKRCSVGVEKELQALVHQGLGMSTPFDSMSELVTAPEDMTSCKCRAGPLATAETRTTRSKCESCCELELAVD